MGLLDSTWVVVFYSAVIVLAMLRWGWNMIWPPKKWDHLGGFLALAAFVVSYLTYNLLKNNHLADTQGLHVMSALLWGTWLLGIGLHIFSEGWWVSETAPVVRGSPKADLGVFSDGWQPAEQGRNRGSCKMRKRQARRRRLRGRR